MCKISDTRLGSQISPRSYGKIYKKISPHFSFRFFLEIPKKEKTLAQENCCQKLPQVETPQKRMTKKKRQDIEMETGKKKLEKNPKIQWYTSSNLAV
jgi:hypothetical protein